LYALSSVIVLVSEWVYFACRKKFSIKLAAAFYSVAAGQKVAHRKAISFRAAFAPIKQWRSNEEYISALAKSDRFLIVIRSRGFTELSVS
jgi:hypothetical protein